VSWEIRQGKALDRLREMPDESVQCCVTSPPYWGLRDYGVVGQLGLENTPEDYIEALVETFAEVRRVLRSDGILWVNLGDSYADRANCRTDNSTGGRARRRVLPPKRNSATNGRKPKDLMGLPWMLAFALRADGWWLRAENIWGKRNGLPDGKAAYDRPDRSHEHFFMLTRSERYFWNREGARIASDPRQEVHNQKYAREYEIHTDRAAATGQPGNVNHIGIHSRPGPGGRNMRSVWMESVARYDGAHFAVFPPAVVKPCITASTVEGQVVLDPFAGAATTGLVATQLGRDFLGIELNPEYVELGRHRILDDAPLFNTPSEVLA
jgi:DNA modification methylase